MSRDEFKRLLGAGHGRAIRFLQQHRPTPFPDVLEGAIVWHKHDFAPLADRSWYLLDAAAASTLEGDLHRMILALAEPLPRATDADSSSKRAHAVGLVASLAQRGHAEALALARAWNPEAAPGDIQAQVTAALAHEPDGGDAAPAPARPSNAARPRPVSEWTFEELAARIAASEPGSLWSMPSTMHLIQWRTRASARDLRRAAEMVRVEDPPHVTVRWLMLFGEAKKCPVAPEVLSALAAGADAAVSHAAFNALISSRYRGLRELSLRVIRDGVWTIPAFQALAMAGNRGDMRILRETIESATDERRAAECWYGLVPVFQEDWTGDDNARAVLRWLYERLPSAPPRSGVVQSLFAFGLDTPEIADECLLDASQETRGLARRRLAGETIESLVVRD